MMFTGIAEDLVYQLPLAHRIVCMDLQTCDRFRVVASSSISADVDTRLLFLMASYMVIRR